MKYSKILFVAFLLFFAQSGFAQENAEAVLEKAQKQAKAENKNVMVFFHASWCGWCKRMEKKMDTESIKNFFDENYVVASLDVLEKGDKKKLENPGGQNYMEKLGGKDAGLPYFVFLDPNGKIIETSLNEKKENLGCPSTEEEIKIFSEKLQKSSKLNPEQLQMISTVFLEK
ncbi:thioredoxin family protein [Frigoriflavimonas asaccharolytica]|uniref:Thioredoxin-related protein n=1 Tax=Frigoriflavimonas asaccharolytica TaxID=2735899 RepID=A0A8J8G8W1_9FLAO|nr:thioredoxin family protein [Frigoriflavimonas asaccharolytica]NRS93248.1 thioredoxin-related protein [Frigoriflavimonas asaccharolytica]